MCVRSQTKFYDMEIHLFTSKIPTKETSSAKLTLDLLGGSAKRLGHELHIFDVSQCRLNFGKSPHVLIENKRFKFRTLLVRVGTYHKLVELQSSVINQFEMMGVHTINSFESIMIAKNKIRQLQILSKHRIAMPKTFAIHSSLFTQDITKTVGSFPVIIKTPVGSQGVGVVLVESKRGLRSLLDVMTSEADGISGPVIIQEYVRESRGKDLRIFVVGNKIVGAMDRVANQKGEFRSNFSLGGRVKIAELSTQEKRLALRATSAIGLDISGVDIVRSKTGPKVLEVNSNPGLKAITEATGKDIAEEIIRYYVSLAKVR
jgi:ribosomal protein S6--L-glutamate ligase